MGWEGKRCRWGKKIRRCSCPPLAWLVRGRAQACCQTWIVMTFSIRTGRHDSFLFHQGEQLLCCCRKRAGLIIASVVTLWCPPRRAAASSHADISGSWNVRVLHSIRITEGGIRSCCLGALVTGDTGVGLLQEVRLKPADSHSAARAMSICWKVLEEGRLKIDLICFFFDVDRATAAVPHADAKATGRVSAIPCGGI